MLHVNVPLVAGDGRGVDRAEHMALLALEQVHDDLEAQQARVASELRTLGIHLTPRSGGARAGPARPWPWSPCARPRKPCCWRPTGRVRWPR
jgi:hypothetical protein